MKKIIIESFLKSFFFSFILFVIWGCFSLIGIPTLVKDFDFTQLLWLIYNVTISLLFLIRVKPTVVSMNPTHWMVALITSFSGFIFTRQGTNNNHVLVFTADTLIILAVLLGIASAFNLGRSYDFLPALRQVKTRFLYQIVRHPMYLSSIVIKLGYVLKYPSAYNVLLLTVITVLYDKRAKYEEETMSQNKAYVDYLKQVRYRFVPRIYWFKSEFKTRYPALIVLYLFILREDKVMAQNVEILERTMTICARIVNQSPLQTTWETGWGDESPFTTRWLMLQSLSFKAHLFAAAAVFMKGLDYERIFISGDGAGVHRCDSEHSKRHVCSRSTLAHPYGNH